MKCHMIRDTWYMCMIHATCYVLHVTCCIHDCVDHWLYIYVVFIEDLKKCALLTHSLTDNLNARDASTSKNIYLSNPHFVVFQSGWHVESWGDTSEIDCGNVGFGKSQVFTEWANTLKWRFEGAYPLVGEQLSSVILWCHSSMPFWG